jgi:hypothetical protein
MAEETTETTEVASEPEAKEKSEAKGLRGQLEKSLVENKKLRSTILTEAYAKLELDTDKGLGKAIAKEYEGEASFDALAEYAKNEYGHEAVEVAPDNPVVPSITDGHTALDQLGQTAGSVPLSPTDGDVLAEAESTGDYATTMAIKGQQMADMMRTRR